jgi:hypothetical protein
LNTMHVEGFGWMRRDSPETGHLRAEWPAHRTFALEYWEADMAYLPKHVLQHSEVAVLERVLSRYDSWLDSEQTSGMIWVIFKCAMARRFPSIFSLRSYVVTENGCRSHRTMSDTFALLVCSSTCEHWRAAFKNALQLVSRSTNWMCFVRILSLFSELMAKLDLAGLKSKSHNTIDFTKQKLEPEFRQPDREDAGC